MTDIQPFLKELLSLPGLSGFESPVRERIAQEWRPLVDELSVSKLGSLHGLKRGAPPQEAQAGPNPSILLAGHMDAIGLMVTAVTAQGFLRVFRIGGVDQRILPGTPVLVQSASGALPGVIAMPEDRLLPEAMRGKPVRMANLLIDTGLSAEEVQQKVHVGDPVMFATPPVELAGGALVGHSLDDRAAVVAITECLRELQGARHAFDVYAVATVNEEESLGGGSTSPVAIQPSLAIAIDVTHAKGPGASDWRTAPLGQGVTLDWGPNTHPALFEALQETADALEIPYAVQVYPAYSGTDAMGMQIANAGLPTAVISIPLRYMHTPVELVSLKDITRCGRLLAGFIARLPRDFVESKLVYQ